MLKNEFRPILALLIFVACGAALLLRGSSVGSYTEENHIYQLIWLDAWGIGFLSVLAILWGDTSVPARRKAAYLLSALSIYGLVAVTIIFAGTQFPENGYWGDQKFRMAMLTKFVAYLLPGDYYYQHLPAFYPPVYYWLLALWGKITGAEGYSLVRTGYQLTYLMMPFLLYWLWRRILSPMRAFMVVAATFLADAGFNQLLINAPHSFVGSSFFVPWWLHYVEQIGPAKRTKWSHYLIGGIIGAVIFATYFYPFFVLAVLMLARTLGGRRLRSMAPSGAFRLSRGWKMIAASAVLSMPYWLPILISIARFGADRSRGDWHHIDSVGLAFPFLSFSWAGAFFVAGLAYLVWRWRLPVARSLVLLLACVILYFGIGSLLGALNTSINLSKVREFSWSLMGPSVGLGLAALFRYGRVRKRLRLTGVLVSIVLVLVCLQGFSLYAKSGAVVRARSTKPPSWSAGTPEMQAMDGKVILTAVEEFSSFHPVYMFIAANEHYSHPAAQFIQRYDMLNLLQGIDDPYIFHTVLRDNQFDAIDYFQPEAAEGRFRFWISVSNYPNKLSTQQLWYSAGVAADTTLFASQSFGIYRVRSEAASRTGFSVRAGTLDDSLRTFHLIEMLRDRLTDIGGQALDTYTGPTVRAHCSILKWPQDHSFGKSVYLIGANAYKVGDSVHLYMTLRANRKVSRDFRVFLHVYPSAENMVLHNFDFAPTVPTSNWQPGDVYTFERTISVFGPNMVFELGLFEGEHVEGRGFQGEIRIAP